ncbi:leucine-rich repeat-containing protein 15-like [Stylophora pistillata]|uniref:leucine-rich repeat-containing protein 15-like n=1 Tax=Stylophora pistillata TaxID=50429 RepID=UPI000C057841|nr:leucine-rich repeat-containing protein 15-like [Stylophora pistillata]
MNRVRIKFNPTLEQAPKTQYVFLNRTSNLWCPVKGAPAPYVVWRKDGFAVQNSTSITFQLKITSENNANYSCEVQSDGEIFRRDICLRVEECPDPCECDVFQQTFMGVDCSGKKLNSVLWKFPLAMAKLRLDNNHLEDLPNDIFTNNINLIRLWLDNNQLKKLPSGIFSNNNRLLYLWLYNNQLKKLPPGIFSNNTQLTVL